MSKIQSNSIEFSFTGIGNLILNNNLQVPLYQRSYSWEEKQVTELFQDLIKAVLDDNDDVYFMGTIVSTSSNDRLDIIDGQQRIATITMILAIMRDYFYELEDNDRVDLVSSRYLRTKDLKTLELIPKIRLNEQDNQFFCDYVLRQPDDECRQSATKNSSSNERIEAAFKKLQQEFSELTKAIETDSVVELIDFIHNKLSVVHIRVADDSNAFTIFETLNDRGLSLAITDLLKNYLFGLAGDRLGEVQNSWATMYSLLDNQEDKKIMIDFLRHFFSAKYDLVREKDLYQRIKEKIKTKINAVLFSKDLSDNAFNYISILHSDSDFWRTYNTKSKEHLKTLNELGFVQVRPLLLAISTKFSKREVEKSLAILVSITVRLLTKGTSGSGSIEEAYCRTAQKIYSDIIKTTVELKNELSSIIPTNVVFKNFFSNITITKSLIARYLLISIENYLRKEKNCELFTPDDETKVNLEHILPQKPDGNWSNFNPEEHKAYYRRLGNMTLLAVNTNSDLKSSEYNEKAKVFGKSDLELNRMLVDVKQWNVQEIEKRQAILADIAIKVWKV